MRGRKQEMKIHLISAGAGALAGGLMLPLFSAVIWLLQLPVELGDTFALFAFGVGCLTAGIIAGCLKRQGGLGNGVKAALLLFAALCAFTLFTGNLSGEFFLARLTATVLCGSAGGVIGVNRR